MIKVVIDTNVVVSANLIDEGPSAAILDLAANKKILRFVSPAILAEYEEVLRRPRLKLDPARIADSLAVIRNTSMEVLPTDILKISGLFDHGQHQGLRQGSQDHENCHAPETSSIGSFQCSHRYFRKISIRRPE